MIRPTALDALFGGQNCRANARTSSQKDSAGKTWFTSPSPSAFSKSKVSPVAMSSIAFDLPMSRPSRCVPPVPGSTPRVTSGRPILPPPFLASRRSQARAISRPPPTV